MSGIGLTAGVLVVDAANVVGSRPDGWWRDRAGAAGRLLARIDAAVAAGHIEGPVVVVLEGQGRGAQVPEGGGGPGGGLTVVSAPGSGDDAIVHLVEEAKDGAVTVVTADRGLASRVRRYGAGVEAPTRFLDRLG